MKRFICIILCAILLLSLLAGCSDRKNVIPVGTKCHFCDNLATQTLFYINKQVYWCGACKQTVKDYPEINSIR